MKMAGGKVPVGNYKRAAFDAYPTPEVATRILLSRVKFEGSIWECASGKGDISSVLEREFPGQVFSSDIQTGPDIYGVNGLDFLMTTGRTVDNILTNPPFSLAEQFIEHALKIAQKKSAFLLRLAFLEGQRRYKLFTEHPPAKIIVISRRLPFCINGQWEKTGAVFGHAWMVFDKEHTGPTTIEWATY